MGVRGGSLHRDDPPPTVATRCTKWGPLFGVGKRPPVLNGGFRRARFLLISVCNVLLALFNAASSSTRAGALCRAESSGTYSFCWRSPGGRAQVTDGPSPYVGRAYKGLPAQSRLVISASLPPLPDQLRQNLLIHVVRSSGGESRGLASGAVVRSDLY